ncbi:MAG: sulfotransferase [Chloroflexi bacterium]|nr:sulfotransferase [Chloroflexota bacterium]
MGFKARFDWSLRWSYATVRRFGEHARFALRGRPKPEEAIVLAASGRSGSTWLGDMLGAAPGVQSIFEPLHPRGCPAFRRLVGWDPNDAIHYHRPYLRPNGDYPEWRELLERTLTGRVRTYWTDYQRNTFFPNRFLIKFIRANMMLGYIYDAFRPTIIFLARHPCAVIRSRLYRVRRAWPARARDVLQDEALVEDHLRPWVGYIERENDLLGAHAVWWAVENRVAMRDLASRPHHFLFYESLCLNPEANMKKLYQALGFTDFQASETLIHGLSRVTTRGENVTTHQTALDWLSAWRRQLTPEEQRRILTWAERLEIPWYDQSPLPRGLVADEKKPISFDVHET